MVDFTSLAAVATRLIKANGRDVTLKRRSRTPDNPDKPWRGTDCGGDQEVTVRASITSYTEDEIDGDLVRRGDRVAWVGAESGVSVEEYDFLVDGGARWKIMDVEKIRPATTAVAYRLQLRR